MNDNKVNTGYEKEFISIKEASILTGIQPQTLRKLGDSQKIKCYKTLSGQRKFHKASLEAMCHSKSATDSDESAAGGNVVQPKKNNYIYARVSNRNLSASLTTQTNTILAADPKYANYQRITDISLGTNYKRKGFQTILKECLAKNIGELVITKRDRLGLIGFELIEQVITMAGGNIVVLCDNDYDNDDCNIVGELIDILHSYHPRQRSSSVVDVSIAAAAAAATVTEENNDNESSS